MLLREGPELNDGGEDGRPVAARGRMGQAAGAYVEGAEDLVAARADAAAATVV